MSRALAAVLFLSCLLASPVARADDRARARALFEQAAEARAAGQWEEARGLLEEALEAYPQFPIAWNLVTAVERTGDLPAAERLLERMRDGELGTVSAEERESVLLRLDEIGARLATLRVVTSGSGGTVTVDGSDAVELDDSGRARVRVIPGTHELSMVAADGRRLARTVDVGAGETLRVVLSAPELAEPALPPEEPLDEGGSVWESPWLWVVVGAIVLGGATTALVSMDGQGDPVGADFEAAGL